MNSKGASAGCRTAHHHHYYHHHHQYHRAAATRAGLCDYGSGADRALMNRTMDSLNYWKRAFGNPEQMSGLGERLIRLGVPGARSASVATGAAPSGGPSAERLFGPTRERKVSATRSSCKCIRTSASAAKLQLLKTLSPIQNSPQFLESPIAAMTRKSSEVTAAAGGVGDENENFASAVADCYKYGIDDLTDTDDASPAPQTTAAWRGNVTADGLESELETDVTQTTTALNDKPRRASPARRRHVAPAADPSTRSQLENAEAAPRLRTRRNTGNGQRSTVIGIADYYDGGSDYAGQCNGFLRPSVMMYSNQPQQKPHNNNNDRKSTASNTITSHNNNNNNYYVYGDYRNAVSFNFNNSNANDAVDNSGNNNKLVVGQRSGPAGPLYRSQPACAAAAAARPPTGVYDDEDGTLVFAIEI